MSSADIFRYASMNRQTMESLRRKEEQIRQEEMRLKLLNKDVEGRKREVEGILQQTQNALANVQELLAKLQVESQELERKKAEQAATETDDVGSTVPSDERLANIKVTAGWLGGMEPADAAETLKNLANSGKMEFALRLLSFIEPRKVAGILDALQDPTLVAELTEGFLEITRPPKTKKR
jgi:5'-3' exonuclease